MPNRRPIGDRLPEVHPDTLRTVRERHVRDLRSERFTRVGDRHNERIHSRTNSSAPSQFGGSTNGEFADR